MSRRQDDDIDPTMMMLDRYFKEVKDLILSQQSPITGLLASHIDWPAGHVPKRADGSPVVAGRVHDNLFSIMSVWALALAYRRVDHDRGRIHELEQSVVKCMRGLLICMMRQLDKVEVFKLQQREEHALHAMYDVETGTPVLADDQWCHLRVGATALFILQLAQMVSSGLEIVYTTDEVACVQNLVFYIERAYRTPDYGVWDPVHGRSDPSTQTELHASSIGMTKAALEAIGGLDLFLAGAPRQLASRSASTIYVDPDAHYRNRDIFESLLPRESRSHETDAALLAITGFPAFSVDNERLLSATRERILSMLAGPNGCRRFIDDPLGARSKPVDLQRRISVAFERAATTPATLSFGPQYTDEDKLPHHRHHNYRHQHSHTHYQQQQQQQENHHHHPHHRQQQQQQQQQQQKKQPCPVTIVRSLFSSPSTPSLSPSQSAQYAGVTASSSDPSSASGNSDSRSEPTVVQAEWPVFYVFLLLESLFRDRPRHISDSLRNHIETLLVPSSGAYRCVPGMHCAPAFPNAPFPAPEARPLPWAHSLLLIADMIRDDCIAPSDMDPLSRCPRAATHLSQAGTLRFRDSMSSLAPMSNGRKDLVVQVALIAETDRLQAFLNTYGIVTQVLTEIEPTHVCPAPFLVRLCSRMGANDSLSLSGRPPRPLGSLSTSKVYMIQNCPFVFYPNILDQTDFYMSYDDLLLIDEIKSQLTFVRNNWSLHGRPLVCLILKDRIRVRHQVELVSLMADMKKGVCNGVRVQLGRLQQLMATSCIEHLDFVHPEDVADPPNPFKDSRDRATSAQGPSVHRQQTFLLEMIQSESSAERSAIDGQEKDSHELQREAEQNEAHLTTLHVDELRRRFASAPNVYERLSVVLELIKREGEWTRMGYEEGSRTARAELEIAYERACGASDWSVVRCCAGALRREANSIAPSLAELVVRGKEVSFGRENEEVFFAEPQSPGNILSLIFRVCEGPRMAVLMQEILLFLSELICVTPDVFNGINRVRVSYIVDALQNEHAITSGRSRVTADVLFWHQSPCQVKSMLKQMFLSSLDESWTASSFTRPTKRQRSNTAESIIEIDAALRRRRIDGALNRTPPDFFRNVWTVLQKCPAGIAFEDHHISSVDVFARFTHGAQKAFEHHIESTLLYCIAQPELRQLTVELLNVLAVILGRIPEIEFQQVVQLDTIIHDAADRCVADISSTSVENKETLGKSGLFRSGGRRPSSSSLTEIKSLVCDLCSRPPGGRGGSLTYLAKAVVLLLPSSVDVDFGGCAVS